MNLAKSDIYITDCRYNFRVAICPRRMVKRTYHPPVYEFDEETGELIQNERSILNSIRRARVTIVDMAMCNDFEHFGTITLNSEWHDLSHPDIILDKLLNALNNYQQRVSSEFQYIIVPELGEKKHRLHFHFLFKGLLKESLFINKYKKLDIDFLKRAFGHIQVTRIKETHNDLVRVAKYCSKYMSKDNIQIRSHRYFCSKGLKRPTKKMIAYENGFTCSLDSWLEDYIKPYCDMPYAKAYALSMYQFKDLKRKFGRYSRVLRRNFCHLGDNFLIPFDDLCNPFKGEVS